MVGRAIGKLPCVFFVTIPFLLKNFPQIAEHGGFLRGVLFGTLLLYMFDKVN